MKKSLLVFFILIAVGIFTDSCKKDDQSSLNTLLTASPWTLASVQVDRYIGGSNIETDTLNTDCLLKQTFTFSADQTCTYQNFICKSGTAKGTWSFSDDKLLLQSDMMSKDTVDGGRDTTDAPFKNAKIVSLGSYSLVLETGNINAYFTSTTKRVIKRYAFIHQD